ncbi:MAG: arginyltransferase [Vicinamibacterales bacterium]
MARLLQHFLEPPHPCAYLPTREASLEVRVAVDVSPEQLDELLQRGWRRFGPSYFRPACPSCRACVPTRVPVAQFRASRSQRRARNQSSRLRRFVGKPQVDDERLQLYARWHLDRERAVGWDSTSLDAEGYAMEFAFPHPSVREVAFRDPGDEDRLVGIGIVDEVPSGLSAVYFFWDPEHAPSSLGTAHIVRLIDEAATRGLEYVHLGYRVDECPSLAYKGRFQPQEALAELPAEGDPAMWRAGAARVTV